MQYQEIVSFHGHECPGLAIGYRMSLAAMKALDEIRSPDEEVVAIVENKACGVDALQCVSGCTFGKGNLLFRDYGKQVYTLFSRKTGKGIRVVFHGRGISEGIYKDRQALLKFILEAPEAVLLSVTEESGGEPEPARIEKSLPCESCGEAVMESRMRNVKGKRVCIPCTEKLERL